MKKILVANWKMNKTSSQAKNFLSLFDSANLSKTYDLVICPPFTALPAFKGARNITLGAQNFHPAANGAYTGEVSAEMLREYGVKTVLVGHSERRRMFGETDAFVNEKVRAALGNDLYVLLCVGETLIQRQTQKTETVLKRQLSVALKGVTLPQQKTYLLAVAYEPVWAIGTGHVATADTIEQAHAFIKKTLEKLQPGIFVPVLYGGSVNEKNASQILGLKNVDGVLVGGASLDAEVFGKFPIA